MKRILNAVFLGFLGTLFCNSAKAEFDSWGYTTQYYDGTKFYTINSSTGEAKLVSTVCDPNGPCGSVSEVKYNESTSKLEYKLKNNWYSYDLNTGAETEIDAPWASDYQGTGSLPKVFKTSDGAVTVQVGDDKLVTKKANGEMHIGENSWITIEENGRQKVYAKDAAGNPIPIDYTNGSKLLINGRDVEQSINNVGALSAALTGLPIVPTDTNLACGLGTGTHGGDFAFSGGCASKVNEKLSINYAASMTMPGQDYAGDFEDQFSARAGFVWKFGKPTKTSLISLSQKKNIDLKISKLEKDNKKLVDKNNEIISQNQKLLARLETLENIASKFQSNSEMISVDTKD